MLSLSNASLPSFGGPSDYILQSNNNNTNNTNDTYNDNELLLFTEFLEASSHSPSHEPQQYLEPFSSPGVSGEHQTSTNMLMKKKQSHNANERDRRMKISSLYTTLRSLLPYSDQTKKLSIPGTVAQVVKYIPELQKEVKKLYEKKEELLSIDSSKQKDEIIWGDEKKQEARGSVMMESSLISVTASSVANNKEVLVQFSTTKLNQNLMSKVLEKLEEDGLCVLNASSYEAGDNIFHSLHLQQVQGGLQYDVDAIPQGLIRHCSMRS